MKLILGFMLLIPIVAHGQEEKKTMYNYDSLGQMQGYWKLPSNVNYVNDKGRYGGVGGYEYGNYLNDQKTGIWVVKNNEGNLLAHRVYVDDSTEFEVQYKNGKIFSVITTKVGPVRMHGETNIREAIKEEIISFNKRGKIRSRKVWRKQEN